MNKSAPATIIDVTVRTNATGVREARNYKWVGDSPYVFISHRMLNNELGVEGRDEIYIGPYRLLKIESRYEYDATLYVRADKFGKLRVFLYRATRWVDLIYRRLIITLTVWNLADRNPSVLPCWQDIKFLKWLKG